MHDAGGGIAQQGLHVDTGAEVLETALGVLRRGGPVVGLAAGPVLHSLTEHHGPVDEQDAGEHVERGLHGVGDATEHLTGRGRIIVLLEHRRRDTRQGGHSGEGDTDEQDELGAFYALAIHTNGKASRAASGETH